MQPLNLPGPIAKSLINRDTRVVSTSYPRAYPFAMDHGKGTEVWDVDGNRFLDFAAGVAVVATGHSHPLVVKAIQDQAEKFIHQIFIMRSGSNDLISLIKLHPLRRMPGYF